MSNILTIIIPKHKETIITRQCLDSIKNQTCQDFYLLELDYSQINNICITTDYYIIIEPHAILSADAVRTILSTLKESDGKKTIVLSKTWLKKPGKGVSEMAYHCCFNQYGVVFPSSCDVIFHEDDNIEEVMINYFLSNGELCMLKQFYYIIGENKECDLGKVKNYYSLFEVVDKLPEEVAAKVVSKWVMKGNYPKHKYDRVRKAKQRYSDRALVITMIKKTYGKGRVIEKVKREIRGV